MCNLRTAGNYLITGCNCNERNVQNCHACLVKSLEGSGWCAHLCRFLFMKHIDNAWVAGTDYRSIPQKFPASSAPCLSAYRETILLCGWTNLVIAPVFTYSCFSKNARPSEVTTVLLRVMVGQVSTVPTRMHILERTRHVSSGLCIGLILTLFCLSHSLIEVLARRLTFSHRKVNDQPDSEIAAIYSLLYPLSSFYPHL